MYHIPFRTWLVSSAILSALLLSHVVAAEKPRLENEQVRVWTDTSGKFRLEAKLTGVANGMVQLTGKDNRVITVPLSKLSGSDITYIRGRSPQQADAAPDPRSVKCANCNHGIDPVFLD